MAVTGASKNLHRPLTRSHAALRRVSMSEGEGEELNEQDYILKCLLSRSFFLPEPSRSLRMYSSGLSSKASSSAPVEAKKPLSQTEAPEKVQ